MLNLARKKMAAKSKKKRVEAKAASFADELNEARWSVVSFEKCVAKNLTYAAAEKKLAKLEAGKIAGLCIVSDETAARISKSPK